MTLPEKLTRAVQRLQIADVTLKSINATLSDGIVPGTNFDSDGKCSFQTRLPSCSSVQTFEPNAELVDQRRVIYEISSGIRFMRKPAEELTSLSEQEIEEQVIAIVEVQFIVTYDEKCTDGDGLLDEEALHLFAQQNVPFNVWPYWREVIQSACGRMGLPRIVLPTHRLRAARAKALADAADDKKQEGTKPEASRNTG